jgi:predicted dehydrogenase
MKKHEPKFTRRKFLGTAALAIGMPTIIPGSALGKNGAVAPSNRIVMGGIGIGPRGREVLKCFLAQPDVQFVAIADVQESRREIVRRMANKQYGNEDCYKCCDMMEILGREDIDAVQITTGDRWHALGIILASKAGKDIYAEKPCSMTIHETQELADAVKANGRVFQAGTQRRNVDNFRFAAELARSGRLGKIHTVHAGILPLKPDLAPLPGEPLPDPALIDWERWLGPAPLRPYNKKYVEGRWRGHYAFHGGAGLPEWGAHTLDLCQWAANADGTTPVEFESKGDTLIEGRYASGVKLVMREAGFKGEGDWVVPGTCPVRFEGEEGWVETADFGKIAASHPSLLVGMPAQEMFGTNPIKHVRDFLDCVKSRGAPAANEVVTRNGHIACHAAAIGWQLGRKVRFDPATEKFIGDDEANKMCSQPRRAPWHA